MKKQAPSCSTSPQTLTTTLPNFFSEQEIFVSDIILDLPNLISQSESLHRFSFTWGATKRRSVITSTSSHVVTSPSSLCDSETDRRTKAKVEATSPSTPLSFLPSESDCKSKNSLKRSSKKRTREEWLEIVEGLSRRKELLKREVENVRNYYSELQDFNLKLKAKKQELSLCLKKEEPHLVISTPMKINLDKVDGNTIFAHQQQFIIMETSGRFQYPFGQVMQSISSNSGLSRANQIDPRGIPDLNVSAEDISQHFVDNRAIAAEARKRRMMKIKEMKNSISTIKSQRWR